MRGLVTLAVNRPVTVLMFALAISVFGVVGYGRLSLDLLPDISYPSITVQTSFPDTAPAEVENLVTMPVEETVGVLKGLRSIHSVSRPGLSEVTLEFDWGAPMEMLSMEVRENLDRLFLPAEAEDPVVLRFDPSLDPILRLAFTGRESLTALRQVADRKLKQELETVEGVAAVQIKGGLEEEIRIDLDQNRLAALGIPIEEVRVRVGISNINLPGGTLEDAENQFLIRMVNEYDSIEEIAGLQIRPDIRLRDVARVFRGTQEREEITRVNGAESVEIDIFKEGDANIVTTARAVQEQLALMQSRLPGESRLVVLFDQSRFIERAVNEVRTAALAGGLLAILVLFAFLRHARSTLIIATAIPLSLLATFLAMYRLDLSLNIMSLGGLTLGIGMLVDNAIVVIESIFRKRREEGLPLTRAAVAGTVEVGGAVVASTLTTVAVFLPIVFVEGIAGQLFGDMAATVTLSLIASLLVAVTLIPMLSAAGETAQKNRKAALGRPSVWSLGWFSAAYDGLLRGALHLRWATIGVAVVLFAGAILALPLLDTELIPAISEGEFYFEATLPEGTPLEAMDRVVKEMEAGLVEEPGLARYYSTVGSRLVAGGMSLSTEAPHYGQINLVLENREDEAAEAACAERLRHRFAAIPDLSVKHGTPAYFSLKTPIEVILFGEDRQHLQEYATGLEERLRRLPGLVDLRSSLEEGNPEIRIVFNRDRLASLGLEMRSLSESLRNRIQGAVPTRFKDQDRQIDIRVRNREEDRASLEDIRNLVVPGPDGNPLRLLTLAEVSINRGPAEIHRLGQERAAVISGNLEDRSLGAVIRDIEAEVAAFPPPRGIDLEMGGQNEEMEVSFKSLCFAMGLAIFLVYLVMASTFESLVHPLIVLFSVPLAGAGVVAGLLVTETGISVIVLIGVVMLVGIVVNNAIVLIDKVNRLRREGLEKREALVRACHIRLRPILMTTLTTVLGLLPMALALGEGAELRAPLAITVSFGLLLSTLLTLVVIPAVYLAVPSRVGEKKVVEEPIDPAPAAMEGVLS